MIRIALLGCGTVGRAVARRLLEHADEFALRAGCPVELARILVRDIDRDRGLEPTLFANCFEDIAADESIDLVIELLGGLEPARGYVERLLRQGVHVVTANKTLLAHAGAALQELASRCGVQLAGEASVGGASPMLSTLRGLHADSVESLLGIVSGSCNFIVTSIQRGGLTFEEAIAQAQERGLLEPDPSADLSLRDTAEKLCVMAQSIGWWLSPGEIARQGIDRLTREDLRAARELGYVLRCVVELDGDGARVGPALVAADHPLAAVDNEQNALLIRARDCGHLQVRGPGAGPAPTAATVLGDVVNVIRGGPALRPSRALLRHVARGDGPPRPHCLRCLLDDDETPDALLEKLARAGVGVARIEWRRDWAVVLTRAISPRELDEAIDGADLTERIAFRAPCIVGHRAEASAEPSDPPAQRARRLAAV